MLRPLSRCIQHQKVAARYDIDNNCKLTRSTKCCMIPPGSLSVFVKAHVPADQCKTMTQLCCCLWIEHAVHAACSIAPIMHMLW